MQNVIRPVASLFVLAIFLLIALATGGSSNTTVASKECKPYDSSIVIPQIRVNVFVSFKSGDPIHGASGKVFISRQEIQDTTDCTFLIASIQQFDFFTDAAGIYFTTQPGGTNYSDGDLWLVEVDIPALPGIHEAFRDRKVLNGNKRIATFDFVNPVQL